MFKFEEPLLVIEDSENVRQIVYQQLKAIGFKEVVILNDAHRALATVIEYHDKKTPFQLVLVDLNMPGPSGLDFLKELRADPRFKNLPFVLSTTEGEKGAILQATQMGVTGYLEKPFSATKLITSLREALARK